MTNLFNFLNIIKYKQLILRGNMYQTIYIDILISVNLFINYFTLKATSKFLYLKSSKIKMVLAALLGAVYSLYILLPYKNIFSSMIIKFLMSVTIILVAFGLQNKKTFIKCIVCFYSINFAFSGCILALWFIFRPNGLIVNNGMVYFNISPLILITLTVLSYTLISIINKFIGKQESTSLYKKIHISISKKEIVLNAKIDTGNNLKEPFSNLPVIVVNRAKINDLIPKDIQLLTAQDLLNPQKIQNVSTKLRLIPFKTISSEGILPAFKPDYIIIHDDNNDSIKKEVYIAICKEGILDPKYDALINPEILK